MMERSRRLGGRSGFTLVELIVAVTLVLILAAIAIPAGFRYQSSAKSTACLANLRQIGTGVQLYMTEHQGRFPSLATGATEDDPEDRPALNTKLLPYVGGDPRVFSCPTDNSVYPETGSSYHWNILLNDQHPAEIRLLGLLFEPTQTPMVYDADSFHSGTGRSVNILFVDGSTAR